MSTEFHEGDCCGGCIGELEEGYYPVDYGCCCYTGLHPLEQWGNPVKHPPVDGKVPEVFHKWGVKTQVRYIKRFWYVLSETYEDCLHMAHSNGRPCPAENCLSRDIPPEPMRELMRV